MLGKFSFAQKAVVLISCAVLVGAYPSYGEEVTASKIQFSEWFPSAYSVLSLRQYNETIDGAKDPTGVLQVRYSLGVKFFDEKLDTSLTLAVNKRYETERLEDSDTISQRIPEFVALYELVDHDLLKVKPYTVVALPIEDRELAVSLGSVIETGYDMDMAGGKVSIGGGADLWLTQSKYTETEVKVFEDADRESLLKSSYSLTAGDDGDQSLTLEEDYLRYGSDYGLWASYEPEMVDGLSVGLSSIYQLRYVPDFKGDGDDIERDGYEVNDRVENAISVSYDITDSLSISNDFYYYVNGFFEEETASDETRSLNRIRISYAFL